MKAGDNIPFWVLAERDHWRCHLCNKAVSKTAPRNTPKGGTLDHLVPLSKGGTHTWTNVKLAHHRCNSLRREFGTVQLMLVG